MVKSLRIFGILLLSLLSLFCKQVHLHDNASGGRGEKADNSQTGLGLTDEFMDLKTGKVQPGLAFEAWKINMAELGKHIADIIEKDPIAFQKVLQGSDSQLLVAYLNAQLEIRGVLPPRGSLFDFFIKDHSNLAQLLDRKSSVLGSNFLSAEMQAQRDHLTAILAMQWNLEFAKPKGAVEQRGASIIEPNPNLNKLYLKYIDACNRKSFLKDIIIPWSEANTEQSIYEVLSDNIRRGFLPGGSLYAYDRQGVSSHLQQSDLINPRQFGIDMRFLPEVSALNILPSDATHLLVGWYQNPDHSVVQFYKQELWGTAKLSEFKAHLLEWNHHNATGGASTGYRETNSPTAQLDAMFKEIEDWIDDWGGKNLNPDKVDLLKKQLADFKNSELQKVSKTETLSSFLLKLENFVNDALKLHSENPEAKFEEYGGLIDKHLGSDAVSRIGSEIRLSYAGDGKFTSKVVNSVTPKPSIKASPVYRSLKYDEAPRSIKNAITPKEQKVTPHSEKVEPKLPK